MTTTQLFENATRRKYRYPYKGKISTEDLWDLDVNNLDEIYKTLNKEMKESLEESLIYSQSKENKELAEKLEIIKHIVSVKLEDQREKLAETERAETRRKLLELKAEREHDRLREMSDEELDKMLEELK